MLSVQQIDTFYDKSQVLNGVSLEVGHGKLVSLLGRNGAGKTTTLRSVVGVKPPARGRVLVDGQEVTGKPADAIARLGVALVPEHRGIFVSLTVEENLQIACRRGSKWGIEDVYGIFPRLKERRRNRGHMLSGGEQQMLAIGRALVNNPRLILLDEPTEGLAPVIVEELTATIGMIRDSGISVLLVEQNLAVCMQLADWFYVLEDGHIVYQGPPSDFADASEVRDRYLGVGVH